MAAAVVVGAVLVVATTTPVRSTGGVPPAAVADQPTVVGSIASSLLDGARGVVVSRRFAYVASQIADRVTVLDVSNPAIPRVIGSVTDPALDGASTIALVGRYAYVTSRVADALAVLDLADPVRPQVIGSVKHPHLDGAAKVVVDGRYAYVTAVDANAVAVVDVLIPASPVVVGSVADPVSLEDATGIESDGRFLYVTGSQPGNDRFSVVDVAVPTNPVVRGTLNDPRLKGNGAVALAGRYAYSAAIDADALTILDISDPDSPVIVGSVTTGTGHTPTADMRDVVISGDYAYVVGRANAYFTIIDVSDPSAPQVARSLNSDLLFGARALAVSGRYAYVAAYDSDRLTVVDLGGLDVATLRVGSLEVTNFNVTNSADVGRRLSARAGAGPTALTPEPALVPLATAVSKALGTAPAAIANAWGVIDRATWTVPADSRLQARLVVIASGAAAGDALRADFYDVSTRTVVIPGGTAVAAGTADRIASGWVDVSGTVWRGNPRVSNQTAARGVARSAWIEFRFAPR